MAQALPANATQRFVKMTDKHGGHEIKKFRRKLGRAIIGMDREGYLVDVRAIRTQKP
jgi:hypothetical protein